MQQASSAGQNRFIPRKTQMNRTARTLVTLALSTLLSALMTGAAFAQVTGQTIQEGKENQQARIAQGFAAAS
jgi:hypothetical protein